MGDDGSNGHSHRSIPALMALDEAEQESTPMLAPAIVTDVNGVHVEVPTAGTCAFNHRSLNRLNMMLADGLGRLESANVASDKNNAVMATNLAAMGKHLDGIQRDRDEEKKRAADARASLRNAIIAGLVINAALFIGGCALAIVKLAAR